MNTHRKDWQTSLHLWLQKNPRTIPDDLRHLREDFRRHYPIESLKEMTLDDYAVGKPDSFCYWLEFKTKELGSIKGGSAAKFGVWWSKSEDRWRWNSSYKDAEHALHCMTNGIAALARESQVQRFEELDKIGRKLLGPNRYSLRGKPIYLYFPEDFLPVSNPEHLRHFLHRFGEKPQGDLITMNRQLLALLQSYPQFNGFDTYQMMVSLYDCMAPRENLLVPPGTLPPVEPDLREPPINNRTKVFISYSHEDKEELARLLVHLRATRFNQKVEWWDDTQIKPGADWHEEIQHAIAATSVAVLLISVDYLASDFIVENELPPLLTASEEDGITILPVIVGPCGFKHTKIAAFQAMNDPSIPLSKMNKHEKDEVWNKVIETVLNPDNS